MSVWCRAFCLRLQLKPESEHCPSSRLPALSFSDQKNGGRWHPGATRLSLDSGGPYECWAALLPGGAGAQGLADVSEDQARAPCEDFSSRGCFLAARCLLRRVGPSLYPDRIS